MMRCCSKEEIDKAVKKFGKSERDICHVCPAKLSKRELEDLYFALLQNNIELKKTLNQQNERQRQMNTKLLRMTATQKTYLGKEAKDCCVSTKALVHEQKNVITQLTKDNENLQEQIKQLNMKLCSTKQFLRRGSAQLTSRATSRPTSTIGAGGSAKNLSSSALNLRGSDDANPKMISVSCQCLDKSHELPKTNTESCEEKGKSDDICDKNKCKTEMDELKLKIVNLQEELSKTHEEYSTRISRLEQEMSDLHSENFKARSEMAAKTITIETKEEQVAQITKKLRDTECQCDELSTQLTIEKGKVAELETQVKAANVTSEAVKNIEEKLSHVNMIKSPQDTFFTENRYSVRLPSRENPLKLTSHDAKSPDNVNTDESTKIEGRASTITQETLVGPSDVVDVNKTSKTCLNDTASIKDVPVPLDITTDKFDKNVRNPCCGVVGNESENPEKISLGISHVTGDANSRKADDSGYTEPLKNDNADESATTKGLRMMNEELMSKMANLQSQLDAVRIGMIANSDEFAGKNKDATQLNNSPETNISPSGCKYKRDLDVLTDSDDAKPFSKHLDSSVDPSKKQCSPSIGERSKSLQKGIIRWQNGKQDSCKTTCEEENLPCEKNCEGAKDAIKVERPKTDSDSRYQIPGPIPSSSYKSKYSQPKKPQQKSDEPDNVSNVSSDIRSLHFGRRRSSFDRKNIDQYADEKPKKHRCSADDTRKTSTVGQKKNFLLNQNIDGSPPLSANIKNTNSSVQFGMTENLKTITANEETNSTGAKDTPALNRKIGASYMSLLATEEETLPVIHVPPDANAKQRDNAVSEKDHNNINTTSNVNYTSNKDSGKVEQDQCACVQQSTNSNAESSSSENKDNLDRHADKNVSQHSAGFALHNIEKNNLMLQDLPDIKTDPGKRSSVDSQGPLTLRSRANHNSIDLDQDLTGKGKLESNSATMHKKYVNAECETSSSLFDMPMLGCVTDKSPFSKCQRPEEKAISSVPEDTFYTPSPPLATSSPCATQEIRHDTKLEQIQTESVDVNVAEPLDDACDQNTHVCTCPHTAARKDIAVFRSCSGTLRFRTTNASALKFRRCNCPKKSGTVNCGTQPTQDKPQQYSRHDSGGSLLKTYTVPCSPQAVKCTRATSPENTDQEISSMTDLPSEKSDKEASKSLRCKKCFTYGQDIPGYSTKLSPTLSLGEDKATTTFSESTTAPFSHSLSEGELPQCARRNTGIQQNMNNNEAKRNLREESASQKVEQALQAISLELAKCRQLLLLTRSQEVNHLPTKELPTTEAEAVKFEEDTSIKRSDKALVDTPEQYNDKRPSGISLKRAEARPRIGDAYTPRVMFTLHIGTVVLSDEAVINSRELALVLTWQFYEQNVAMCRLRPGRVVPFDFSTEYDLKLTDDFLEYLKSEELAIKICEENKLDVPFASCSLPLREALLHTNRRADLSLALVAGPQMHRAERTADALDGRDELGVLDVWCMLRADPKVVPNINKSIAHSTRLSSQLAGRNSSIGTGTGGGFTALTEDEQEDLRVSADLEPMVIDKMPLLNSQDLMDRGVQQLTSNQARQDRVRCDNYGYRDSVEMKHQPSSMNDLKRQVSFDDKWAAMESRGRAAVGIIANEVPANIKSNKEMKEALEKNYAELPRRTSNASSKDASSIIGRKQKKLSLGDKSNILMTHPTVENYLNNSNYANTTLPNMIRHTDAESTNTQIQGADAAESAEIAKKFDYVSRFIGAKKTAEAFKKVTIKPEDSVSLAPSQGEEYNKPTDYLRRNRSHSIDITILWLALNDECQAMGDPNVQRLYVAYTFLGRGGAELETPISLPKPKQYQDKCHFNFKKSFQLAESDLPTLGRMAKARSTSKGANARESIVFTVVSEPVEDPLGLNNCEDIGNAHLFLGDLLAYSAGNDSYTEVIPVRATVADDIIGVIAVRVDGLDEVRKCLMLSSAIDDNAMPDRSF